MLYIFYIQAVGIGDPAEAPGCDSSDAEGDSVAFAEFVFTVLEQLGEGAVDVAEAEEAEVVGLNVFPRRG